MNKWKWKLEKLIFKNEGFSLIELMVVVLILSLITIGLVTIFSGGIRSWVSGQSQLQAQREARQAMDRMVREIREASNIVIGSGNTSITISYPSLFSKGPITYKLSGDIIEEEIKEGSNPLNISNVKTLLFTTADPAKVHILLEVDGDDDGNPDIMLNSDVNLRNYGL